MQCSIVRERHLEAAFSFGHVLLRVEEDDVDLGHVEHPQSHGGRQAERDGEGGGLDVHLETEPEANRESFITFPLVKSPSWSSSNLQNMSDDEDKWKGKMVKEQMA